MKGKTKTFITESMKGLTRFDQDQYADVSLSHLGMKPILNVQDCRNFIQDLGRIVAIRSDDKMYAICTDRKWEEVTRQILNQKLKNRSVSINDDVVNFSLIFNTFITLFPNRYQSLENGAPRWVR
jgi:hypothetical protein